MPCETCLRRRTALQTLSTVLVPALSASVGARGDAVLPPCAHIENGAEPELGAGHASRDDTSIAVVDRIVDGDHVVLLLEDDEAVDQSIVARGALPDVEEGDVLLVTLADGDFVAVEPLDVETERRRRWARQRLGCLRERP